MKSKGPTSQSKTTKQTSKEHLSIQEKVPNNEKQELWQEKKGSVHVVKIEVQENDDFDDSETDKKLSL
jgi:hypothetical protein